MVNFMNTRYAWSQVSNTIAAAHPDKPRPPPPVTALAKLRTDVQVVPTQTGNQLVRPSGMLLAGESSGSMPEPCKP